MKVSIPLRFDTSELESATRQLAALNNKDISAALNKKMGWLMRRWMWNTPKANALKIGKELSGLMFAFRATKKGAKRTLKTSTRFGSRGQQYQAPVAALLINSIRRKRGLNGLYGNKMKQAIKRHIGARQRSVAYLKSGIASALKPFLPFASGSGPGVPSVDRDSKLVVVGRPKGFGTPARAGVRPVAVAVDKTFTKRRGNAGLVKVARPALEKAYRDELADTVKFLNNQLYETAKKAGISARR